MSEQRVETKSHLVNASTQRSHAPQSRASVESLRSEDVTLRSASVIDISGDGVQHTLAMRSTGMHSITEAISLLCDLVSL